jgi:hypothetical protein
MAQITCMNDKISSASNGISIVLTTALYDRSIGLYIGTTQSIEVTWDGINWVQIQAAQAGSVLPLQVIGARKSGGSAFTAGDCVFLY